MYFCFEVEKICAVFPAGILKDKNVDPDTRSWYKKNKNIFELYKSSNISRAGEMVITGPYTDLLSG